MEGLFVRPWAQVRMHDGPLGPHIDAFLDTLADKGYARNSLRRAAWLVGDFSRWLLRRRIAATEVTLACVDAFSRCRKRHRTPRWEDRPTLARLLTYLAHSGVIVITIAACNPTPAQQLEAEYAAYMRRERNLAPATIHGHRLDARRLLMFLFADGAVMFENITAQDIITHVACVTRRYRPASARRLIDSVRAFFRFALYRGLVTTDLSKYIPSPAIWSQASIPRAWKDDDVRRLLAHCDQTTANGCRDYAIILLLARLGLRAGEVVSLQLEDIDWCAGELKIRNGHTRVDCLPLPQDVGEALARYLREGRPHSSSRCVFIRAKAPRQGFAGSSAIATIVRRALRRADLDPPYKGSHALRHSLATRLLREGASLTEIGEVLRHRQMQTTTIYAKVDLTSLRTLATSWPGGVR
jgi:site-specific recombinase XerD